MQATKFKQLTDKYITDAKPEDHGSRISDSRGLYIALMWNRPFHLWRFDFVSPTTGKRNTLNLGEHPAMSVELAREKAAEARKLIAAGVCPAELRDGAKEAAKTSQEASRRVSKGLPALGSFKAVALSFRATKWQEKHGTSFKNKWADCHALKWLRILETHAFPTLANRQMSAIEIDEIFACISALEKVNKLETAKCLRNYVKQIFDYAVVLKLVAHNPVPSLKVVVAHSTMRRHNPAPTTPEGIFGVLKEIDPYEKGGSAWLCFQLLALTWQRPGNVREMEWSEINFETAEWTIPSVKMKRTKEQKEKMPAHVVPLPRQAIKLLKEQKLKTGLGRWVMPSTAGDELPVSESALSNAIDSMGLRGIITPHGFRAMARTGLDEIHFFDTRPLEANLAHSNGMSLKGSYARATWLDRRAVAVQLWADYLDELRQTQGKASKKAA